MSNQEFENYVALIGKLLQLTREQRDQISGELQDHLQMRVADLTSEGVSNQDAINQALEEFGDAAAMAKNFQTVINLKRRRWMMRFATYSIVGAFLAAILTMAMWPEDARFGTPNQSLAQASPDEEGQEAEKSAKPDDVLMLDVSAGTKRDQIAEENLKKIVDLDFVEQPFRDVEFELEELTNLNFLLHSSAQDDSLSEDEPITFKMENMPLDKSLQLMLEIKNATYVIDEGVVVIISLDDADDAKWHRLKMFDCRELVAVLPQSFPESSGSSGGGRGGFGGGQFCIPQLGNAKLPQGKPQESENTGTDSENIKKLQAQIAELTTMLRRQSSVRKPVASSETTLVKLVQSMVGLDSWEKSGQGLGQVDVVNGILVVKQTEVILRQVENLIRDLEGNVLRKGTKVGLRGMRPTNPLKLKLPRPVVNVSEGGDPFGGGDENPFGEVESGDQGDDDPFGDDGDDPFGQSSIESE